MKYIVIQDHQSEYHNPLLLQQGEKVMLGKESGETWPNWIFCTRIDGSNKGWVPKQIIKQETDYGIILEDYSAKELNISTGTIVEGIKELNGWLWLKNKETNEIGWVPMENLKKLG